MKNIKVLASLFLAVVIASSCEDYLEPDPVSFVGADSFFQNDTEIEAGVLSIYDALQGINVSTNSFDDLRSTQLEFYLTEMRSDNTGSKNGGEIDAFNGQFEVYEVVTQNSIVRNYYQSMYNVIFRSNLVLENLGSATESNAPIFEGEARFTRAYAYFQLVRLWGAVPMPLEVIDPDDTDIAFTRVDKLDVYNQIIEDFEFAAANLKDDSRTRASKSAAQGLLAKVYLTLAGAEGENVEANYAAAADLCREIIASGQFQLEDVYRDVFYNEVYSDEGNTEVIFAINYINDNVDVSQSYSRDMSDLGTRFVNYTTENLRSFYFTRGDTERALFEEGTDDGTFPNTKFVSNAGNLLTSGNDWIVLRYADVLLMLVEATIADNASITGSTSEAVVAYNLVRSRANMAEVSLVTKDDLLEERRAELAFENQRFFDLFRFGVELEVLSAHSDEVGGIFTPQDRLLPFPQVEVNLAGDLLEQNPGY